MTPARDAIVRKLRRMSRTMTQAEAARVLHISRQGVHQLAQDYGIPFRRQRAAAKPQMCHRCDYRMNGYKACLRCKWTPRRVRRLRERHGLSQIKMSLEVLQMHVWACTRWESGRVRPRRRSLVLLEQIERSLDESRNAK